MIKKIIGVALGALSLVLVVAVPRHMTAAEGASGRGITVVPPNFELYANPGESLNQKIRVRNESDVQATYQIIAQDFTAQGEDGAVELLDEGQSNDSFSLAKWIQAEPKDFTLNAKEEKEIYFTVNVPKNAEPGGHYGSVLVSMGGGNVQGGASVASRVGSLVLLRVSGNVKEEASVQSFGVPKFYSEKAPAFDLRIKNNGNNHIKPKGTIVVTNLFGQKVAEIPLNGLNVLPGAIRKMETTWKPKSGLANYYKATLVATYGQQNKPLSATVSFIVFPKALAVAYGVGIVLLGLVVVRRKDVKKILHNITK